VSQWQPIETAPKDGSMIVVFSPEFYEAELEPLDQMDWFCVVRWNDGEWRYAGGEYTFDNVTHWMPLPDPPEVVVSE
jgi:hypothetical protein